MSETRLYGVSFGNGNDGVSHMFPDFYVRTDDPWTLARIALVESYAPGSPYYRHAARSVEVNGEADYTVAATLYEGPDGETQFGAAERICLVFPDDGPDMADPWHRPVYESLDEAFGADVVARYRAEG